jgi:hypothetical protein
VPGTVNIRSRGGEDKENSDELEKEGMGARKKARVLGGKENIGQPQWMLINETNEISEGTLGSESPKKKAEGDKDALLVPRKRTNANHLITPRKPSRKRPMKPLTQNENLISEVPALEEKLVQKVALNDTARSEAGDATREEKLVQKMPLNDPARSETGDAAQEEKPARRRKSLRKSMRRLTRGNVEEVEAVPVETKFTAGPGDLIPPSKPTIEPEDVSAALPAPGEFNIEVENRSLASPSEPNVEVGAIADTSIPPSKPVIEGMPNEISPGFADLQIETSNKTEEQVLETGLIEDSITREQTPDVAEVLSSLSSTEHDLLVELVALPDLTEAAVEKSSSSHQNLEMSKQNSSQQIVEQTQASSDMHPAVIFEEQTVSTPSKTLEQTSAILETTEIDMKMSSVVPTKTAETPKAKRKTPQRRGTRRSTRNTRASSVQPEENPSQQAEMSESHNGEKSNQATPRRKSRSIKDLTMGVTAPKPQQEVTVVSDEVGSSSRVEVTDEKRGADSTPSNAPSAESQSPIRAVVITEEKQIEEIPTEQNIEEAPADQVENNEDREAEPLGTEGGFESESTSANMLTISGPAIAEVCLDQVVPQQETNVVMNVEALECQVQQSSSLDLFPADDAAERQSDIESDEPYVDQLAHLNPIYSLISSTGLFANGSIVGSNNEGSEELPETSTPDPATTELVESISDNATLTNYDDETDMLRSFLTRVKANKAAKAGSAIPKRKRSLPHSPLRLPLETADANISPSLNDKDELAEFDVSLPASSPHKRRKHSKDAQDDNDDAPEGKSIRRSGRTRLPMKLTPIPVPSFIPVRRLGQDGDSTVTLRRSEEKELAALTRVNTRKNKGGALRPLEVLAKKLDEKEDPASRQRALKEVFDEKAQRQKKGKKGKSVVWAEELAQFQTADGKIVKVEEELEKEKEKVAPAAEEEKKSAVRVGVRSKIALGMAVNGKPAPKRRKGRS